ncbi:hypothetical protein ACPOL_6854 (plasmid) [Acidisarcina polymorpha]|uniref:Uncharacterized protein n=2 Tax=Acidisarcina polymorpha TaxID=2211140 RepID=A0A2Z5G9W4_9BACT|nr:hypothetical protein ACPOL_6854 [Acidisarcina polymorpha]
MGLINIHGRMRQFVAEPHQLSLLIAEADEYARATLRMLVPKAKLSSEIITICSVQTCLQATRLSRLTKICLALPGVRIKNTGDHATFLVNGRNFAHYLSDYQGDGIIGVCCRLRARKTSTKPLLSTTSTWFTPTSVALISWVGLRLDLSAVDWDEVSDLIQSSYLRVVASASKL